MYTTLTLKESGSSCIISDSQLLSKERYQAKEGHCIVIKSSFCQQNITILNMHAPNNRTSKYAR